MQETGTALDLGCGTGSDAIWLAQEGWTVTGVDISGAALQEAAAEAVAAGVSDQTSWLRVDLEVNFAEGAGSCRVRDCQVIRPLASFVPRVPARSRGA